MLGWLKHAWRTLTRGADLDDDLHDELESYVDLAADDAIATGLTRTEARRRTLAGMGGLTPVEEAVRAGRRGARLREVLQDARYGLRLLRRAPVFAGSAILTLGLAIGATAAMVSVVRAVVVAPLPYPASSDLIVLTDQGYVGEYLQYRDRSRTFSPAGHSTTTPMTLTGRGEPIRLETVLATSDLLDVLGVRPELGSGWAATDAAPGAEPTVLLSHRAWRDLLAADTSIIGKSVVLDGLPHRVKGVLPQDFAFPHPAIDLWLPVTIDPADRVALWSNGGAIIGRLRDGASLEDARAEVQALAPSFGALFPWRMGDDYGQTASALRLKDQLVGNTDVMFAAALAAVALVLVIASLNVGILLMGRALGRRLEMATRAALGASRGRLARQAAIECLVLSTLGGVVALGIGALTIAAIRQWMPADMPRLDEIAADGWLVGAVLVLTLTAAAVIAVVPVWRAARPTTRMTAAARASGPDRGTRLATGGLVALEVGLAVMLVIGAGLLARSLDRLFEVDPGFAPHGVVSASLAPSPVRYGSADARKTLFADVLDRVAAMPDVSAAALTDRLPFAGPPWGSVFTIEGRPDPATSSGDWPWADYRAAVSPTFFATLGVRVARGRVFTDDDGSGAQDVAVISSALAAEYWPGEDAVGRRIRFPGMVAGRWIVIVGVVDDIKWERLNEESLTALYIPLAQAEPDAMSLVVRTADAADNLAVGLRTAVQSLDPDMPVDRVASLQDLVARSARTSRFLAVLFAGFAGVGLLLGALGVFGVTSDAVTKRSHEIAVRLAIGARPGSIVGLIVRQGVFVAAIGIGAGLAGALAGSRYIGTLLFGITATDPVTYVAVPATLLLVLIVACLVPARRAMRIQPLDVLRE